MTFESTAIVLAECKLQYYRILECAGLTFAALCCPSALVALNNTVVVGSVLSLVSSPWPVMPLQCDAWLQTLLRAGEAVGE